MPPAVEVASHEPREEICASAVLERLLVALPQDRVSVGWLHGELREHSFEMLALLLALIGVLPGASVLIAFMLVVPALGMMFSSGIALPDLLAQRSISTRQATFVLGRAIPLLRSWEAGARSSNPQAWKFVRPVVGALSLVLAVTLLVPVPLSNVLPALSIAGLSLAAFERNFVLLCASGFAAVGSLALTCVTLIAASQAFAGFGI